MVVKRGGEEHCILIDFGTGKKELEKEVDKPYIRRLERKNILAHISLMLGNQHFPGVIFTHWDESCFSWPQVRNPT